MQEQSNILRILQETLKAVKSEDVVKLRELSDQTIHTASITQDPDNIAVAVIVYSLSKIIERQNYKFQKGWEKFYSSFVANISHAIDAIKKQDEGHLRAHLEDIRKRIDGLSRNLKNYIKDVFYKASINKASKIYEHGISLEKTAKLLGVSMFELASYAGQKISDYDINVTMNTRDRIKLAMRMFE